MNRERRALIVIDFQNDFTREDGKSHACVKHVDEIIPRINDLINLFEKSNDDVIYIKTEWTNFFIKLLTGNAVASGSYGAELDKRIKQVNSHVFIKDNENIFSNVKFVQFLKNKNINKLYFVGLAVEYCIKTSFQVSQKYKYKTYVVRDAVATYRCNNIDKAVRKYISEDSLIKSQAI